MMKTKLSALYAETKILLRSIPATVVTLFAVSVVCMNLLANKTIVQLSWLALDGGMLISWLSFMCMDIITKHFGPRASTIISIHAATINLLTCLIFFTVSTIKSDAADYTAFDSIFGGTWFVLLGSTVAFLTSAVIYSVLNHTIGKCFRRNPHGKFAYAMRSYVSTFIGQFCDNFVFSVLVFTVFAPVFWDGFSWTLTQCAMCALTGAVAELLMGVAFYPISYHMTQSWHHEHVGEAYFQYIAQATASKEAKNGDA